MFLMFFYDEPLNNLNFFTIAEGFHNLTFNVLKCKFIMKHLCCLALIWFYGNLLGLSEFMEMLQIDQFC